MGTMDATEDDATEKPEEVELPVKAIAPRNYQLDLFERARHQNVRLFNSSLCPFS
jgi:hypothetical protein